MSSEFSVVLFSSIDSCDSCDSCERSFSAYSADKYVNTRVEFGCGADESVVDTVR